MTDSRTDMGSITDRIRPVAAGAPVVAVHFLGDAAAFVLGEETILLVRDGAEQRVAVHGGGILSAACDGRRIVTGGDDGKVVATDAAGTSATIATDAKRRWIDRVAAGPDDTAAWSIGKQAFVRTAKGEERSLDLPSSAGGLAFAPKGFRVAIAHYNGALLWFPNAKAAPEQLEWKGSHLDVAFSPDGRFLVTAMQEPTLHGWRLVDGKHMRMSGYAAKVQSMSWSPGGKWLATSGATQLVMWPFQTKDGPMGKTPTLLAPTENKIGAVACHPKQDIVAVGYDDGMIVLVRIDDGAEILARRPGNAPVSAIAWNADGTRLAFGAEDGEAGLLAL
jgi:WD40 repeat protein